MPFSAGNFDAAAFNKAKITMAQLFGNNSAHAHLNIPSPIFKCIAEHQNIKLVGPGQVLANGRRCEGLDVSWLNVCNLDVDDDCATCELDGDELGAQMKTYLNNSTFCKTFKVRDSQCLDVHDLAEKRALALMALRASLDQELERRSIAFLNANADPLTGITLPIGAIDGVDDSLWNIPVEEFKAELFIEFQKLLILLNIPNGRVIDGNNFYTLMKIAQAKIAAQNGGCCTTDQLYNLLPICQDIRNIDSISGENRTFLVDSGNVAYFNTVINRNTSPMEKKDKDQTSVWSIPSLTLKWRDGSTLKPVMYDIKYQYKCDPEGSGHDYMEVFHGEHRGAFILGPSNCNDRHGIIKIASLGPAVPPGDGDGDGEGDGEGV